MPNSSESFAPRVREITRQRIPRDWLHDLDLMRRVIERSETVNKPRNLAFSQKAHPVPDFRIATISTNIDVADLMEVRRSDYKIWVLKNPRRRQRLCREFLSHVKEAADAGANLICCNELAYPTSDDTEENRAFREAVQRLVNKRHVFLIAGSYHDRKRCYNLCPVFSPIPARRPQGSSVGPFAHAKLTSAVKVFELIRIPSNRDLRYYVTSLGSFNILVCLDAYDPSLVLRLIRMNYAFSGGDKIEVVFVPSFSLEKGLSFARACEDLSYATASVVVYVNCRHSEPLHAVYLAGKPLPPFRPRRRDTGCWSKRISRNVSLHQIRYDACHQARVDVTDAYSPVFLYLIGQKDGLRYDIKL